MLSAHARSYEGKTVELTRSGIGVITMDPEFRVVRRTVAGERGVVTQVTDAGLNGLQFQIRLTTGETISAYLRTSVRVVS